jgi:CubicO group peptidase (beta-lactamase class C family)
VLGICAVVVWYAATNVAGAEPVFPGQHWAQATPAQVGLDAARLAELAHRLGADDPPDPKEPKTGCVIRDGYLVYSWGPHTKRMSWASASKPVVSTLLLFAVQDGKLHGVNDRIADWGWALKDKDRTMTFAHLANQTGGYACQEPPGQAWAYNDFALQLYTLTLEKVFGKTLNAAALEHLGALGFEDGDIFTERRGVKTSARDFARIGWFWMNRGNWNGRQLLPAQWFDRYMKPHVPRDLPRSATSQPDDYLQIGTYGGGNNQCFYGPGVYGFNWWFNGVAPGSDQLVMPDAPPDAVMAMGIGGRFMVMVPSLRLIVAARGNWGDIEPGEPLERYNANLKLLRECVIDRPIAPASQPAE